MEKIIEFVCIACGITEKELFSKYRCDYIVDARFMVCAMARMINPRVYTLSKLGNYLGKHHASIYHSLRRHEDSYENDKFYKKVFDKAFSMYEDWEKGYITEEIEEFINTPYGNRKAFVTKRYNKYE